MSPRSLLNRTRRIRIGATLLGLALAFSAGAADKRRAPDSKLSLDPSTASQERTHMWMTIGGNQRFAVTLEDNATALAFVQLLPLTLDMPDLNGNEKHVAVPSG